MPRLDVLLLYSPKALKLCCLGRSSDLSLFECLPIRLRTVARRKYSKILKDLQQRVCSGFAPDSHFHHSSPTESGEVKPKLRAKVAKTLDKKPVLVKNMCFFVSCLWLLPFPLEETVVPAWGNCRSHLGKLSSPLGETVVSACGNEHVLFSCFILRGGSVLLLSRYYIYVYPYILPKPAVLRNVLFPRE